MDSASNLNTPQIVTEYSGNAHAVWYGLSGSTYTIYYAYRAQGGSWGTPVTLSSFSGSAPTLSIVADLTASPTAYVAWMNGTTLQATTVASPYTSGASPTTIDNSGFAQTFSIAYNDQINTYATPEQIGLPGAILVYGYHDGATNSIYYTVSEGSSWSSPATIVTNSSSIGYKNPQVTTGAGGTGGMGVYYGYAYTMWIQENGSTYNPYLSTVTDYTSLESLTWGSAEQLSTSGKTDLSISPSVANYSNRGTSQDQEAFGTWVENPSTGVYDVYCVDLSTPGSMNTLTVCHGTDGSAQCPNRCLLWRRQYSGGSDLDRFGN